MTLCWYRHINHEITFCVLLRGLIYAWCRQTDDISLRISMDYQVWLAMCTICIFKNDAITFFHRYVCDAASQHADIRKLLLRNGRMCTYTGNNEHKSFWSFASVLQSSPEHSKACITELWSLHSRNAECHFKRHAPSMKSNFCWINLLNYLYCAMISKHPRKSFHQSCTDIWVLFKGWKYSSLQWTSLPCRT